MSSRWSWVACVAGVCLSMTLGGCGQTSTSPGVVDLTGTWARQESVPGSGETWTLIDRIGDVSGTGSWQGEACCSGIVTINGSEHLQAITFDLVYTTTSGSAVQDPRPVHYDAIAQSSSEFTIVAMSGVPLDSPVRFVKVVSR